MKPGANQNRSFIMHNGPAATDFGRSIKLKDEPTVRGKYRAGSIKKVVVRDGDGHDVEKVLAEFNLAETDELVTLWISDYTVLLNRFRDELRRRSAVGKTDFEDGELIEIEMGLEKKTPRNGGKTYYPFTITFEHAAPGPSAADVLLGDDSTAAVNGDGPTDQPEASPAEPRDDDIPFFMS
jgi:hypothetical protein